MYANPSWATATPSSGPARAMRATVPSPDGPGRLAEVGPVSVGDEQPTASVAPIATATRIVDSRLMRPFTDWGYAHVVGRGDVVATRSAQYIINPKIDSGRVGGRRSARYRA